MIKKKEENKTPTATAPDANEGAESGCGDGKRQAEEDCDDGNRVNGDGCNSSCRNETIIVASARSSLDVGYAHVCLIGKKHHQLKCWGFNDYGQLGQGNTAEIGDGVGKAITASAPINIGTGLSTALVSAGGEIVSGSTCVITNKNDVKCFGDNVAGQLGQGSTSNLGDGRNEQGNKLNIVDLGRGRTAIDIDSGARHQCALLDNGDVKCWGLNDEGQLGQGNTLNLGDAPNEMGENLKAIALGAKAKTIAVGAKHSCVITDTDTVKCWGLNANGQLGQDNLENLGDDPKEIAHLEAIDLGVDRTAKAIAAGGAHTCALLENGDVKCWGLNASGQLGQDSTASLGDEAGEMANIASVNLGLNRTALAITAGENHTCALLDNKTIKCWGENSSVNYDKIASPIWAMGKVKWLPCLLLSSALVEQAQLLRPVAIPPAQCSMMTTSNAGGKIILVNWAKETLII